MAKSPLNRSPFPSSRALLLLLACTILGAFLRFWRLDHQSYWFDEARTIFRTCDSFQHLLDSLGDQGFPPGWYILVRAWAHLIESFTHSAALAFSPQYLRSLPASFGTLMVPIMYLLARQFTDRKGALLVALLTAVNPYLIYYSRDLKMYQATWTLIALNAFLFFQWQTTHRHWLYFPLFVLSGTAAVSLHGSAWFILALELIFILTRPSLKALDGPLWLLGVGIIAILPVWWYLNRTTWVLDALGENSTVKDLDWIARYTDMNWHTLVSLPAVHLLGFLYPEYPPSDKIVGWFHLYPNFQEHLATRSLPLLATAQFWAIIALLAIMFLGLLPWRGLRHGQNPERAASSTRSRWWWIALWIALPMTLYGLGSLPADTTWGLPEAYRIFPLHHLFYIAPVALILALLAKRYIAPGPKQTTLVIIPLVIPLLYAGLWYISSDRPWSIKPHQIIWEPRYLGAIIPAWILWLAASLRRMPTRPLRTVLIAAVVAASLASASSNYLFYRQTPWAPTAAALASYYDPAHPEAIAFGTPLTAFPGNADIYTYQISSGQRPTPHIEYSWPPFIDNYRHTRSALDDDSYRAFLRSAQRDPAVNTIVLTDRNGDLAVGADTSAAPPELALSNEYVQTLLDRSYSKWKLVHEEKYRWYYEWRFYIFHTWRTRVWVRIPPEPTSSPATSAPAPASAEPPRSVGAPGKQPRT